MNAVDYGRWEDRHPRQCWAGSEGMGSVKTEGGYRIEEREMGRGSGQDGMGRRESGAGRGGRGRGQEGVVSKSGFARSFKSQEPDRV